MQPSWQEKSDSLNWKEHRKFLQLSHFRPMYDRAFAKTLERISPLPSKGYENIVQDFLQNFDLWLHGSKVNSIQGLNAFSDRNIIVGVTHSLDDLHIRYGSNLVIMEKEYAYHFRIRPDIRQRNLASLQAGDVLSLANPFPWFGDQHPQTMQILDRCRELNIPVHVDSAWYGCVKGFEFDFSHPAIESVSFSLSKGLGLGSNRVGVRYSRQRQPGPVSVINDFNMHLISSLWIGLEFMKEFGSDYIQSRYGEAYLHTCEKLGLRPTKALHVAFDKDDQGNEIPVGIRPFLRYLVDNVDEFK